MKKLFLKLLKRINVKDALLAFLAALFVVLSIFCLAASASAAEVSTEPLIEDTTSIDDVSTTEEPTYEVYKEVNSDEVVSILDDMNEAVHSIDDNVKQSNAVSSESSDVTVSENVELYLQYITAILVFFVVCLLFWGCYKFLAMFF